MWRVLQLSLFLLCTVFSRALPADTSFDISKFTVPPDEKVSDRSLHEFANEWWKWAYSIPPYLSPLRDLSGKYCGVNQEGNVWYLAGGYGTSKISRWCTIPSGKFIFFPVINVLYHSVPGSEQTCATSKERAAENNNKHVYVRVTLNGSELENAERFRLASDECFNPFERIPEELGVRSTAPGATDGYWIMLKPLPVGKHRLEFRAFYTNQGAFGGDMVQNISYDITVSAE